MRYKKHMIILLAAIFLFAMATASAADLNDTAVAADDGQLTDEIIQASENQENTIQVSNNDEVNLSEDDSGKLAIGNDKKMGKTVTNHTFKAIKDAIESDCTIYLEPGTYTGNSEIYIIQKSNITIIGDSTILYAQGKTRIFDIQQSSNITIQNIIFKNGHFELGNGGAIGVYDSRDCSISNCTFINNTAEGDGGAISLSAWCANGRVSNCTFINNTAKMYGGAINWFYSDDGRVNNCTFINNTAGGEGDAIYADSCDLNADYNWFGNTADNYNDQLPINYEVKCDYRLFLNATANPDTITGKDTSNVTFKLYQYGSDVISDYDNAPFKNLDLTITATNGNVKGTAKLGEPIQFTPTSKGTASVTATVENVRQTVEINVGDGDFELLQDLVNNESLSVINLERNYTYNEFDTITGGVIINRPITINGNGYTIDAKGKSRIFYIEPDAVVIENLTLKNGKAHGSGGAIYFDNSGTVTNCNFADNIATADGGAVYFNMIGIVTNCNFADNIATGDGGAIHMLDGTVTNSSFINNHANSSTKSQGGAICSYRGTVSNCNFTDNTATGDGGTVYFNSESNVSNCNFADNTGGAIYLCGGIVSDCTFTCNFNFGRGGAIASHTTVSNIVNCTFTDNSAAQGGAIAFYDADCNVTNCTFIGNAAIIGTDGGAIWTGGGSVTNCTFVNNTAEWSGGAISFYGYGIVTNCNFTNNTAEGDGGAILMSSGSVENCNFAGNNATVNGGAVYFYEDGNVSNCSFTANSVDKNNENSAGGAIYFYNDDSYVFDSIFVKNSAANYGAVHLSNVKGDVSGCIFVNNSANKGIVGQAFDDPGNIIINNNIFLNNDVSVNVIDFAAGESIDANYNWFGSNATDYTKNPDLQFGDVWLFLNATADPSTVHVLDTSDITFKLYAFYSTSTSKRIFEHNNTLLYPVTLTVTATNGDIQNTVGLDETITYTAAALGTGKVTASIENAAYTIGLKIVKPDPELTVEPQETYYGHNAIIALTYNSTATGTVNITLNGKKNSYAFDNEKLNTTISLGKLKSDEYDVIVDYSGDDTFSNTTATGTLTVRPFVDLSVNITSDKDVYFLGDVAVWTVTVHNAGNGTNATDVYLGIFFPFQYFEIINFTTDNGTFENGLWTIGFMGNGTDATLTIVSRANVTREAIRNVAVVECNETDWNLSNNVNNMTVDIVQPVIDVSATIASDKDVYFLGDVAVWAVTVHNAGNGSNATNVNLTDFFPLENFEFMNASTDNGTFNEESKVWQIGFMGNGTSASLLIRAIAKNPGADIPNEVYVSATEYEWNYSNNGAKTVAVIDKLNSTVNVTDTVLSYGQTANITVTTEGAIAVTAKIGDENATVKDNIIIIPVLDAGNYTLTVTTIPDDKHQSATATANITVNKASTEIVLTNETLNLKVLDMVDGLANLTPGDAGNLTFISSDEDIVFVADGMILAYGKGNATVTVSFAGNDNYAAAKNKTIAVTVSLRDASVSVENSTLELYVDDKYDLNATTIPHWLNVEYASSDESVATVTDYGIVTAVGEGTAIITVEVGDDETYAKNSTTVTVTVSKIPAEIVVQNDTVDLMVGEEFDPVVGLMPSGAGNMSFKSSDADVVLVNGHGFILAVGEGNATVTVAFNGNKKYAAASKNITVSVSKIPTEITLTNETLYLKVNDMVDGLANLTPGDAGNLTFISSDEEVVFVADGMILAYGKGTATVTVSFAGNDKYAAAENRTMTVNVSLRDASVSVENATLDLKVDDRFDLNTTTVPGWLNVEYASSDESVATVTDYGIVTAVGEGTATITLTVGDDAMFAVNSTNVTVTVSKQDSNVNVSMPENITVGENSTVNVVLPEDATGNVTVKVDGEVADTVAVTDGSADVTIPSMSAGNHTVEIAYSGDGKYNPINETKEISVSKKDTTPEITIPSDIEVGDNETVDVKLPGDAGGNVTLKVDGGTVDTVPVENGTASVKLPELNAGNHTVEIAYLGDDKYKSTSKTATITVNKYSTNITAADVTATYKVNKYLVINLADSRGNPLANATVTVELTTAKNYTSDENGQIKVKVSSLVPKTYTAKITFNGDEKYAGSETTAEVTVKKATAKITAKAKTFKTTTKTKKYTVTLKANGKALKNKWVYLKVNGNTYKATTNSKGKATFKITKLSNKGTYKATVTFKANKYYKKATKNAKITVKSVWKTVAKGSKNHAIVKKIQRALKSNGYYLSYNGHYLMVDGIYHDYTKMAVKQFQKANGLKVTGKVDEKTAKKLKLI